MRMAHTERNSGNMYTGPKWKAALYIDERATQQQKDLITKIYSGQAGGFFAGISNLIGEMLGVKSVPIDFGIDGKHRWLRVKYTLELDIETVTGGDKNRESFLTNPPFSVVPGADLTVARSSKYNYSDHGMAKMASLSVYDYCKFKYSP